MVTIWVLSYIMNNLHCTVHIHLVIFFLILKTLKAKILSKQTVGFGKGSVLSLDGNTCFSWVHIVILDAWSDNLKRQWENNDLRIKYNTCYCQHKCLVGRNCHRHLC